MLYNGIFGFHVNICHVQFNSLYSKTDDRSPKGLVCQTTKIRLVLHNVFAILLYIILIKDFFCKVNSISPWAQRGHVHTPPPRILHEWYHLVQGTPLINNRDVNATFLGTFQNGCHRNLPKIELLISWPLVSLETQIWCLNPHFQSH